jgi:HAMP domain-containing protein
MKVDRTFLRSKVGRRIFLLFITCALLPVTILAILSFKHVTSQLRGQSQDRLQQAAGAMGMHLFERLLFLETGMEIAASSLNEAGEDRWREAVAEISGRLKERLESLGVITKADKPISLLGAVQNPPPLTAAQEAHLRKGKTVMSAGARAGRPAVILMRRLLDPDQPSRGTLVAEVKITYLWRGADENPLPPMTQLWVLDQTGAMLFSTLPKPVSFSEQQILEMIRTHSGPFDWRYENREGVGTYSSLYMKNDFLVDKWIIALGEFKAHVLAPMSKFKKIFPLVVLLSLWVVVLLSINQIRRNLIPLERLQEGTKRIAGRDFDTRVTVTSGDEFQELAESFNAMATRLGKQFNALTTMNEIDRSILSALDTRLIVDTVLNRMRELFPCDCVGVALLDAESSDGGLMHVQYGESESENWLVPITLTAAEVQEFYDHPEQLLIDSNEEFPRYLTSLAELEAELFLALPMFVAEELSGLIVLGYLDPTAANEEDAVQARQLADQVAVAISNARLIEELDELNWGTLYALARAIDAKSAWTAGHSERVTMICIGEGCCTILARSEFPRRSLIRPVNCPMRNINRCVSTCALGREYWNQLRPTPELYQWCCIIMNIMMVRDTPTISPERILIWGLAYLRWPTTTTLSFQTGRIVKDWIPRW